MATAVTRPPTSELGAAVPGMLPSWTSLAQTLFVDREEVWELRWPTSVRVTFPRMARDTQLRALERGTILPITRYAWGIDPNGAPQKLVRQAQAEFNLPLIDDAIAERATGRSKPVARSRNRFSFHQHQELALRGGIRDGHAFFEQVGEIGDDGLWHLRKLAARPQWTVEQIHVDRDGGLISISQQVGFDQTDIPVSRLVAYVFDQQPGSWIGESMYKPCFREWLIKDRLLRVDARNHEKGGGSWYGVAAKDATELEKKQLAQAAADMNAMSGKAPAVPNGSELHFERPNGTGTAIESINRHDEAMARAWLLMVIQLGSTQTGARAVGDNFDRLWGYSQEAIAIWFRDVFNEHVIEDWAEWNYGPDLDFVPRLVYVVPEHFQPTETIDQAAETDPAIGAAVQQLRAQIAAGELDDLLAAEGYERRARPPARALSLPDRPLRRDPYPHEVKAAVDFGEVDQNWQAQAASLVARWQTIRSAQVAELAALIQQADGDLARLATIEATAAGGDVIASHLQTMMSLGAGEAAAEAVRQGVTATVPSLDDLQDELAARAGALEQLLARSISEAAARKAIQLTGPDSDPGTVAAEVTGYLNGLTDTYLHDQFGGALSAAQNGGRLATMTANGASRLYASELLDTSTCAPCAEEDGKEFADAAAAAADYPAGGYKDCEGGPRCRGLVVAVYQEAEPGS